MSQSWKCSWGSEQPGLAESVPVHGRGLRTRRPLKVPPNPNHSRLPLVAGRNFFYIETSSNCWSQPNTLRHVQHPQLCVTRELKAKSLHYFYWFLSYSASLHKQSLFRSQTCSSKSHFALTCRGVDIAQKAWECWSPAWAPQATAQLC